ncbi:hypothetical protein V8G54_004081 [Vigna mungo]|uniref:Uncharacterized protein n=1 Tax=Vigna mungo TaxID=3915 RepID=A0AAQ3PF37_VIGMU
MDTKVMAAPTPNLPITKIISSENRVRRKKLTSLIKHLRSIPTSFSATHSDTVPTTIVVTKRAPPNTLLRPTSPLSAPTKEAILANTSGAPFPSGSNTTPATVGGNFKSLDNLSSEGQK